MFCDKFQVNLKDLKDEIFGFMTDHYHETWNILDGFLKAKGQRFEDYVEYISWQTARADQFAIYIMARIFKIHVALICKDRVWYTFEGPGDFSDCELILVYTGGNTWKNTTPILGPPPSPTSEAKESGKLGQTSYEYDPEYVPSKEEDLEFKDEKESTTLFPQPQPVIDLVSEDEPEEMPVLVPEEKEPVHSDNSDDTVIYDASAYIGENSDDTIIYQFPPKSPKKPVRHRVIPEKEYGIVLKRKSVQCTFGTCKKKFPTQAHVNAHMVADHGQKFQCNKCFKNFANRRTREKHMWRHDKSKLKYKCDLCDYAGLFASNLTLHMTTHSREKRFVCDYVDCDKKYFTKGELTKHIQLYHSRDVFLDCPECSKRFRGKKLLNIHMRTHGPPTFECELCHEKFKHYSHLTYHRKNCKHLVE